MKIAFSTIEIYYWITGDTRKSDDFAHDLAVQIVLIISVISLKQKTSKVREGSLGTAGQVDVIW